MTILAFLIGVLVLVVGLAVSVALHEAGHLIPAKLFKVRVGQYMVGFGRTLWSRKIGETEYGVKLLPLGGYISMAGMYAPVEASSGRPRKARLFDTLVQDARDANAETLIGGHDRAFYRLAIWKRVVIMLGGPVMNLLLALGLTVLSVSAIGLTVPSTTVASVSQCVIPATEDRTACATTDPASPASIAGLEAGDRILSIDSTPVSSFADVTAIVEASPGKTLSVVVDRNGDQKTLALSPQAAERPVVDDTGRPVTGADGAVEYRTVGFAGISPQNVREPQSLGTAWTTTGDRVQQAAGVMLTLPARVYTTVTDMLTGQPRDPAGAMSVVGAGRLAGDIAAYDAPVLDRVQSIIDLLAGLNIALFIFNMVPLLPLDGGHILIALLDGARRAVAKLFKRRPPRPFDAARLAPITLGVVALIAVVGAVLITADLINPIRI